MSDAEAPAAAHDGRDRVLAASLALLASDGRDGVTTRAVAAAAGTQAPTIYRLFGDKRGLIDAVAEYGFARYLREKHVDRASEDPVDGLRRGWDVHVGFGLANPVLFTAMYGDPRPGGASPAAVRALEMLLARMRSLALAGRRRVGERTAADMVRAAACGVVFILLETPEAERDDRLSETTREAVIAAVTNSPPRPEELGLASVATTLRAMAPSAPGLTAGERQVLAEWLERLARADAEDGAGA